MEENAPAYKPEQWMEETMEYDIAELKNKLLNAHLENNNDPMLADDLRRVLDRAEDIWNQRNPTLHRQTVVEKKLNKAELREAAGLEPEVPETGEPQLYARRREFIDSL